MNQTNSLSSHRILAENLENKAFLASESLWDEDDMYFGTSGFTKPNKIKGFISKSYGMVVKQIYEIIPCAVVATPLLERGR